MKNLCSSKIYYLTTKECEDKDSNKTGRLTLKMKGETQLEMELYEIVAFSYPLCQNQAIKAHLKPEIKYLTQHCWILYVALILSFKKSCFL